MSTHMHKSLEVKNVKAQLQAEKDKEEAKGSQMGKSQQKHSR